MPRGGRRVGAGRPKGSTTRVKRPPARAFLEKLQAADSHKAVRMLGEQLAAAGEYEAAARTIAKIVRYEASPMPTAAREAPLTSRQLELFDRAPQLAAPKDDNNPDEFAGLLN